MILSKIPSLEELNSKEWLITNGIGGYAAGTVSGANSRRYQGLLVAALNPPTQRQVVVSKVEETIDTNDGQSFELSTNRYPGNVHPQGFQYIKSFERRPFPCTQFQVNGLQLAKTVFMVNGSNTTILEYENQSEHSFRLSLQPFFVDRDYHSLFRENPDFNYYYEKTDNALKIYAHYGATPIFMKFSSGDFKEGRFWYKDFEYPKEKYRGLDFREDAYALGKLSCTIEPGAKVYLTFTLEEGILDKDPPELKKIEEQRVGELVPANIKDPFIKDLLVAGDQFIVHRESTGGYSIIAGYHWFTDWGRDTMIAMRGLCIAPGKQKISKSILETFFSSLNQGMLPNRFPDFEGEAVEYNTVDATLWLFIALYEYFVKFNDKVFIQQHFDKLTDIIKWHIKGTRYLIHLTDEGFIYAGEGKSQLTWMDARVGDYVVTPRHGCPVEIQALWYNALTIYQLLAGELNITSEKNLSADCAEIAQRLKTNFTRYFLNQAGYLNDVVIPNSSIDESIRPNQVYVLSLPFSLLEKGIEKQVFEVVKEQLFTPYGLRTLNEAHPDFKPRYGGDQWYRDTAYHQGTVWPFLLGDYFLAMIKIKGKTPKVKKEIEDTLEQLRTHFYEADCIHGISEIFDGKVPSAGRGTVHQAWSVGALLQVLLADQ